MVLSRRTLVLALGAAALAACRRAADEPAEGSAPPADATVGEGPNPLSFFGDFNALGTEPFWALDVREGELHLQRPDAEPLVWDNPGPTVAGKTATWQVGELVLVLTEETCSDGMSDRTYPWSASVKVGDVELKGCAMRPERALAAL